MLRKVCEIVKKEVPIYTALAKSEAFLKIIHNVTWAGASKPS